MVIITELHADDEGIVFGSIWAQAETYWMHSHRIPDWQTPSRYNSRQQAKKFLQTPTHFT
jgi:hypothetical protein